MKLTKKYYERNDCKNCICNNSIYACIIINQELIDCYKSNQEKICILYSARNELNNIINKFKGGNNAK